MRVMSFLNKLGRSLMLPIAVLPIAGILLRLGQDDVLGIPFIASAGESIFSNLPVIFAICVALGFSKDMNGVASLAGFIGYIVFTSVLEALSPGLNMGVLSGILMGILGGVMYNRFHDFQLPNYLAFFAGRRFVAIITGLVAMLLGSLGWIIWVPLEHLIELLGTFIINSGDIGLFVYGVVNRLLIPFGLHHILNSLVWFQFGDYTVLENGVEVVKNGDLWRFFAGDPSAGRFMTGFFPIFMFGLPGAALAIALRAKLENRKLVFGALLSVAFTAFLTGITEPLEFSFMFLAFPLYVVHAFLTGFSMVVMHFLDVRLGFTFSAGFFDYILSYGLGDNPVYLLPVGVITFVIYFVLFYFVIGWFNIATPGREESADTVGQNNASGQLAANIEDSNTNQSAVKTEINDAKNQDLTLAYLKALGGKDNIVEIECCATRLRLKVKDVNIVDRDAIKKCGAFGVIVGQDNDMQVVIGTHVQTVLDDIRKVL